MDKKAFVDLLDVWGVWLSNGCVISARDACILNDINNINLSAIPGVKSNTSKVLAISDDRLWHILSHFSTLTTAQRNAIICMHCPLYRKRLKRKEAAQLLGVNVEALGGTIKRARAALYYGYTSGKPSGYYDDEQSAARRTIRGLERLLSS